MTCERQADKIGNERKLAAWVQLKRVDIIDLVLSKFYGQATKGTRWMPWREGEEGRGKLR